MRMLGSMPSAQPIRPSTTTVPIPSPPLPTGIPNPPPLPPPPLRSSSTLSLRRKSSQRMCQSFQILRLYHNQNRATLEGDVEEVFLLSSLILGSLLALRTP